MSDLQRAIDDLEGKLTWAKECGNYFVDELIDFDVIETAITALRGPQPDPITGLLPCGCGERQLTT